ncbi:nucleoporin Nup120/160-domain-containing protein [Limtongia smithiae]|uniref:nucleoporin Nup120/160-domain-containing protein n=1 Tax=Limtongia smithiae TaxID=1125753 RepID=UPI0034CEF2EB
MPRDPSKYLKESSLRIDASSLCLPTVELIAPDPESSTYVYRQQHQQRGGSRSRTRRYAYGDGGANTDLEELYMRRYVASKSAMFYRHATDVYPRAFLWRVLEEGTVLEITPADLTTADGVSENIHQLRICFSSPVRTTCVVFSECSSSREHITVDVLTEALVLYTFMLSSDTFLNDWTGRATAEWCHIQESAHFNLRPPLNMIALPQGSLIFALLDGGMMRLDRSHPLADDYFERIFSDGSYLASLKGMFAWGSNDRGNASTNLVVSMTADPAASILFTASINCELKIWSLESLVALATYDIVNDEQRLKIASGNKRVLSPEPITLMSTTRDPATGALYLMTYCPVGEGQFKLWKVDTSNGGIALVDVLGAPLIPPTPDENAIWMITDFITECSSTTTHGNRLVLWVLWKSNKSSRVSVAFDLPTSKHDARETVSWRLVAQTYTDTAAGSFEDIHFSRENYTEEYMRYIFQPGLFSPAIFETVLPVFERHYAGPNTNSEVDERMSLPERVMRVVNGTVYLQKLDGAVDYDYESYRRDLQQQWSRFERLCRELSKQGSEALSFCFDPVTQTVTLVKATMISVVRICCGLEYVELAGAKSTVSLADGTIVGAKRSTNREDVELLQTLASFKKLLPHLIVSDFLTAVEEDALRPPKHSIGGRITEIYDSCLENEISDSALDFLHKRLYMIKQIDGALETCFGELADVLGTGNVIETAVTHRTTLIGAMLISNAVHETITSTYKSVVNILLFLVVFSVDVSDEFSANHVEFYDKFIRACKAVMFLKAISEITLERMPQQSDIESDGLVSRVNNLMLSRGVQESEVSSTILQKLITSSPEFAWASDYISSGGLSALNVGDAVSHAAMHWCIYTSRLPAISIAGMLTARWGYPQIAEPLLRFLDEDAVSKFVCGLVHASTQSYDGAAACFAQGLTSRFDGSEKQFQHTLAALLQFSGPAGLLHHDRETRDVLTGSVSTVAGVVSDIFVRLGEFAAAAEFAGTALDTVEVATDVLEIDRLYARAFKTSLLAGMYDDAYFALTNYSQSKRRREFLEQFIIAICTSGHAGRLCEFPFLELHAEVRMILERLARNTIDLDSSSTNYYKILYAWDIEHGEYQDAASALYEYIQRLRAGATGTVDTEEFNAHDLELSTNYIVLINTLACCPESDRAPEAWFLSRVVVESDAAVADGAMTPSSPLKKAKTASGENGIGMRSRRVLVRLSDVEREFDDEMVRMETLLSRRLIAIEA